MFVHRSVTQETQSCKLQQQQQQQKEHQRKDFLASKIHKQPWDKINPVNQEK